MDKLTKVFEKIVVALGSKGWKVTDDNFDSSYENEEVDSDNLEDHVSDDSEREHWFASVKVTKEDGSDVTQSEMDEVLIKVLGEPTHPFDHSTQKPSEVNNWTKDRGYVLVVHRGNGVDLFEDYTKTSTKRK
jgi:hypothetical protein